jgi:copper(I)-binding protein
VSRVGGAIGILLAVAACGGDRDVRNGDGGEAGVSVVEPWVRAAIRPADDTGVASSPVNSAGYLVLRNTGGEEDAIIGVETEVADTAELHVVTMDDDIMRMRPVESIPVPATGEAVLEPGGYHIMLVGVNRDLVAGDTVEMVVRLRSGQVVEVRAVVRRE